MDRQDKEINPEQLPFELEGIQKDYGSVIFATKDCPGVFSLRVIPVERHPACTCLYAVTKEASISMEARSYGRKLSACPEVLIYERDGWDYHWMIIQYEILRYRKKHGIPLGNLEDMHAFTAYSMEVCPEYFGSYPVPEKTPWGYTTRHKTIHNGVYWIETDQCISALAVCYAIHDDLSTAVLTLSEQNRYDRKHGIGETLGYFFFQEDTICLPLFELMQGHRNWDWSMVDKAALINAVWARYPEYAAAHNILEQQGGHDGFGMLLRSLGVNTKLQSSPEEMIALTLEGGMDFLIFSCRESAKKSDNPNNTPET